MANERVSQLLELYAGELASSDLLLITDMSQRESKKLPISSLMEYIENSGSFVASTAGSALTASYVPAAGVHGTVTSASHSDRSDHADSASYATYAQNAHQSTSASYASAAASLIGGIGAVVSASHALRADNADNATNASYLYYSGVNNGSASNALTASYTNLLQVGHSGCDPAATRGIYMYGAVNDGGILFFSGTLDDGNMYFRTFDNGTEGFRFQTWQAFGGVPGYYVDRMTLTAVTSSWGTAKMTVHGDISASAYTSSLSLSESKVGFVGTASWANSASYASSGNSYVKAWAMVTWSFGATYNQPSLYMGANVSAINYIRQWNHSTTFTWLNYGITFASPMPSTNYTLMGQCFSAYLDPEPADVVFHPVYSNRTTTTCTMSLAIKLATSTVAAFFAGTSGSFPTTDQTYLSFQVLGT